MGRRKICEQTTDGAGIITELLKSDTGQDVYLIKTNSDGNIVWEKLVVK